MRAVPAGEGSEGLQNQPEPASSMWLWGEEQGQNPNPVCPHTSLDMQEGHRGCHRRPWSCTGELRDVLILV